MMTYKSLVTWSHIKKIPEGGSWGTWQKYLRKWVCLFVIPYFLRITASSYLTGVIHRDAQAIWDNVEGPLVHLRYSILPVYHRLVFPDWLTDSLSHTDPVWAAALHFYRVFLKKKWRATTLVLHLDTWTLPVSSLLSLSLTVLFEKMTLVAFLPICLSYSRCCQSAEGDGPSKSEQSFQSGRPWQWHNGFFRGGRSGGSLEAGCLGERRSR